MVKIEKEEYLVDIDDTRWKKLAVCVSKSNKGGVERYLTLCLYVRSEVYDFYLASDEPLCLALSVLGYPHYLNHLLDGTLHTKLQFGDIPGRIQNFMRRLYFCSRESMGHREKQRKILFFHGLG